MQNNVQIRKGTLIVKFLLKRAPGHSSINRWGSLYWDLRWPPGHPSLDRAVRTHDNAPDAARRS